MTTPNTNTPDPAAPVPTEPKGRAPKSAAALEAAGASGDAVARAKKDAQDAAALAEQARIDKAKADEAAFKAKAAQEAAERQKADRDNLSAARKHLTAASPENPIALRRVECGNVVGDTMYGGTARMVIDLANNEYKGRVTLLYDGQIVHVINAKEAGKSFWIGPSNIAAMYPRLDA